MPTFITLENRIFRYALITSLLIHVFLFIVFFFTQWKDRVQVKHSTTSIVYQSLPNQPAQTPSPKKGMQPVAKPKDPYFPKITRPERAEMPLPLPKPSRAKSASRPAPQKALTRIKQWKGKRAIKVPVLKSEKMASAGYLTYHEQVRNRIRNRAYFYVDDPRFAEGEVYLAFVLAADGSLKQVKIIDDRTRANSYLRGVALRSIKESAPFPPFPSGLDYPELSFNVVISFEVSE
ncbi:MAG: hypothetical protein ACLFPX_00190 [Candidatus Omnitrophota bacterium]